MFDTSGSFIPATAHKVFTYPATGYYRFNLNFQHSDLINSISKRISSPSNLDLGTHFSDLFSLIKADTTLTSVLNGPCIPFGLSKNTSSDIGSILENDLLPSLNSSFLDSHPNSHFKVVTQDKQHLSKRLFPSPSTGYQGFIDSLNTSDLIGYYFPFAFPEFSISSQRKAFASISSSLNVCLSGPLEVISASITCPSLLINPDHYSPILCMSGACHVDNRLEAVLKSYGPHLEFWVLSNLLTPGKEQISEQWYGGLTVFKSLE